MPKLPDIGALGSRPTIRSGFQATQYSAGSAGKGFEAVGEASGKLARAIGYKQEKEREADTKLQLAYADSSFLKNQLDIEDDVSKNSRYDTMSSDYEKKIADSLKQISGTIQDENARKLFEAKAESDIARGRARIKDKAFSAAQDVSLGNLQKQVDNAKSVWATAPEEEGRRIKDSIVFSTIANRDKGYMSHYKAYGFLKKTDEDFATIQFNKLSPQERIDRLTKYTAGEKKAEESPSKMIDFIIDNLEGSKDKPVIDNNGALSIYGINAKWNPEAFANGKIPTREEAKKIYEEKYYKGNNIDKLPPNMRLAALDSVIQHGKGAELIKQANGDPQRLIELRRDYIKTLPDYEKIGSGLEARLDKLSAEISPKSGLLESMLPQDKLQQYLDNARADLKKESAEQAIERQLAESRFDLALAKATTPEAISSLENAAKDYQDKFGETWVNNRLTQLETKRQKFDEEQGNIERGGAFARGEAYLNPRDEKDQKAFNAYYDRVSSQEIQSMDINVRNEYLSNIINNAKAVPKKLSGDIQYAARSRDANIVKNAADMLNRVTAKNPNLIQDFNEQDVARINMVSGLIDSGLKPEDAFNKVDQAIDPANKALIDERKQSLKEMKLDYKSEAISIINPSFIARLLPFRQGVERKGEIGSAAQQAQIGLDYKRSYDSHYLLTGDKDAAEKFAERTISGQYGYTKINGIPQIMKFNPERYYSIQGEDNDWMRTQMIDAAKERGLPDGASEDDIRLVSDPYITPRTSQEGSPAYKLMYINRETGSLDDLLNGEHFQFDTNKRRQELITKAFEGKQKTYGILEKGTADIKEIVGPESFGKSIFADVNGKSYILPKEKDMTKEQAIQQFQETGKHYGAFKNIVEAYDYWKTAHDYYVKQKHANR